jgi:hypothetical protein
MRIRIDELPMDASTGDARLRRGAWAGGAVRVLELPPGGNLGHDGGDRPSGLCPDAHWGYVMEGSIEVQFAFGDRETARAGDIYHWPTLHTCRTDEGVRCLEFAPVAPPASSAGPATPDPSHRLRLTTAPASDHPWLVRVRVDDETVGDLCFRSERDRDRLVAPLLASAGATLDHEAELVTPYDSGLFDVRPPRLGSPEHGTEAVPATAAVTG